MDFRKKLKIRLYLAISYIVLGIALIVVGNMTGDGSVFLPPLGLGMTVCGAARVKRYFVITKSEESIRKQQVAESDERNLAIMIRAKNAAFNLYLFFASLSMILMGILGKTKEVSTVAISVCLMVAAYWISWWTISRKS